MGANYAPGTHSALYTHRQSEQEMYFYSIFTHEETQDQRGCHLLKIAQLPSHSQELSLGLSASSASTLRAHALALTSPWAEPWTGDFHSLKMVTVAPFSSMEWDTDNST